METDNNISSKSKKEIDLDLRKNIYQSNPLINSRKNFGLLGMKIFMLGLRGLNPHFSKRDKYYDKEFPVMFISTNKLTELFGNTKYLAMMKPTCQKLLKTSIEIKQASDRFELYHLFRELKYEPGAGLYLQFDNLLRPYLIDLFSARGYTRVNVEYLFKLSSPYAVRLMELLLQYQNVPLFKQLKEIKRKITLEELRFLLNVPEGAYNKRIDNLKKFVLENPIHEINTRTPYTIYYKTIKKGRNVVAFEFTMDACKVPINNDDIYEYKYDYDAVKALCGLGFTERVARAIFKKCPNEAECLARIDRARILLTRNRRMIKNKLGFLRKAIEENWQPKGETEKKPKKEPAEIPRHARNVNSEFWENMDRVVAATCAEAKKLAKELEAKKRNSNPNPVARTADDDKPPELFSLSECIKPAADALKERLKQRQDEEPVARTADDDKSPELFSLSECIKPAADALKERLKQRQDEKPAAKTADDDKPIATIELGEQSDEMAAIRKAESEFALLKDKLEGNTEAMEILKEASQMLQDLGQDILVSKDNQLAKRATDIAAVLLSIQEKAKGTKGVSVGLAKILVQMQRVVYLISWKHEDQLKMMEKKAMEEQAKQAKQAQKREGWFRPNEPDMIYLSNGRPMYRREAGIYLDYINRNILVEETKMILKGCGTTVEKFLKTCEEYAVEQVWDGVN